MNCDDKTRSPCGVMISWLKLGGMSGVIVHGNVQGGEFFGGNVCRENIQELQCSVTVSQKNNNLSPLPIRHFFKIPSWDDLYPPPPLPGIM